MHSRDSRQAIDAVSNFAQPQGDLAEKLFMLRELFLRSLFVLTLGIEQRLDRFGQGFVALYQPVQPLVDGHDSLVNGLGG